MAGDSTLGDTQRMHKGKQQPRRQSRGTTSMNTSKYFKTTPLDSRFPTVNQANHCWNLFNEWVLCTKKAEEEGRSAKTCHSKRHSALSICPDEWTEKWDEDMEEGTFAGIK